MKNTTKLFQELRKAGFSAGQRLGDCRTCAVNAQPHIQVFTHDQSYKSDHTMVYFHDIEGYEIRAVADKANVSYEWNGDNETAFKIWEDR